MFFYVGCDAENCIKRSINLQVGCASLDDLVDKTIPASIRFANDHSLIEETGLSEQEALAEIERYAGENQVMLFRE